MIANIKCDVLKIGEGEGFETFHRATI